jgi:small GTP-binding protein
MSGDRLTLRAVVIGDASVGKTSIINRYLKKYDFDPHEPNTIGAMYDSVEIPRDDQPCELQIWDTAGQEQYRSLGSTYFRNAHGAILVFDVTERKTYDTLQYWLQSFRSVAGSNRTVVIIGNKTDLVTRRATDWEIAADWATGHSCTYLETSALTGEGIDIAFDTFIDELIAWKSSFEEKEEGQQGEDAQPDGTAPPEKGRCC